MSSHLSETLVIGISATALFDLKEADKVFREKYSSDKETAIAEYRKYMLEREDEILEDGTGMPLGASASCSVPSPSSPLESRV